jgi:hypothetical protein
MVKTIIQYGGSVMRRISAFVVGAFLVAASVAHSQSTDQLFHAERSGYDRRDVPPGARGVIWTKLTPREQALFGIIGMGSLPDHVKQDVPSLIKALSSERTPVNRAAILNALCEIDPDDPRVYNAVLGALNGAPGLEPGQATFLLWDKFGTRPLRDLTLILNDKKKSVDNRCYALYALNGLLANHVKGDIPKYVMDSFEANLFDRESRVRIEVAWIVGECAKRRPEQAPIAVMVKVFTTDKSDAVRINLGAALHYCGKPAFPYLKKTLGHEKDDVRLSTLYVIRALDDDALLFINDIEAALNDRSQQVREFAKKLLSELKK